MRNLLVLCLIMLTGCFSEHAFVNQEYYFNQTDENLIIQAKDALNKNDYRSAIKILETFGTLYPLSQQSSFVEKVLIECYYRQSEYPMVKAASDRFIYEHPQDQDVDYVKYLRFLADVKQAKGYPYDWFPMDYAKRDVSKFKDCFFEAKNFLVEYPKSRYAPAVAHALPELKNIIARYYWLRGEDLYSRQQYIGAIQAYQIVLDHFVDTEYETMAQVKIGQFQSIFPNVTKIDFS
jgi:outer membrane assembly lipoprotein YfiO